MNRKIRGFFFLFFIYVSPLSVAAQMIDSMMKVYTEKYPQEKVYVQFDRKAYNPGERIWYKAYIFTGFDPSPYSKSFCAEMYDASGNLILRNTSPIIASGASGSFDIPAGFDGSRIRIKAYTTWMLNFDTTLVFSRDLRIFGTVKDSAMHAEASPTVLHFFPEGGDLVSGVENNVAFRAEDAYGKPRNISGALYDGSGKLLLNITSAHNGMGKFLLVPDKVETFYMLWKDEKKIEQRTDLPPVHSFGIVLRVLNTAGKLIFSVARAQDNTLNPKVTVIAHMNQQMVYKAVVNLQDAAMNGGNIPTSQLPTGVLTITVFDTRQTPLAERVCFINNQHYALDASVAVTTKSLQKRGRNVVDIQLPGNLKTDIAVAITDAEVDGNKPMDDNLVTSLLLTGDIKGYVKDPYAYFRNSSDSLVQQLDLVMLTHGWRRFKWQDLAAGKEPVIKFPVENYLSLNAEVLGVDRSRIAKDESLNVIFQNKDSSNNMLTLPQVSPMKFRIGDLVFYDTAKAYYMFNVNHKLSNEAAVIFKTGLYSGPRKLRPFAMTLPVWSPDDSSLIRRNMHVYEEVARLRAQDKKVQTLDVVTVHKRVKSDKEKLDEEYSSGLFSGGNATIFDVLNDVTASGLMNVFNYLQGKVAGLTIVAGSPPSLSWRGSTPAIYLDEMQVDAGQVNTMPMSDVAMVKVFAPGSAGAVSGGGGGVISVYTKKGKDSKPDPSFKGLDMIRVIGYTRVREFYSPDYLINPEPENDDIRTTLYWNPDLKGTPGTRKFSIPFYNSDVTHRIRVIVEGYDEEGKLLHVEKMIE